jgi:arsenite methyltransferase
VSQITFDDDLLPRLEALYSTEHILRRRRIVREAIAAAPGERILDVGCGPGFYVAELLDEVGPTGAVVGVDVSPQMLAAAARRTQGRDNVSYLEGDATSLPVDHDAFDAALSVQVLEYVPDVRAALAELHRAVRPGGRVVLWDIDWSTHSMHTEDPARMRRVLDAWDGHLTHPALPRTLAAQLRSAGFGDVRFEGHAFAAAELSPGSFPAAFVGLVENYVGGREGFQDEAQAWAVEQRELGGRGDFYFAHVQCCFTAIRAD